MSKIKFTQFGLWFAIIYICAELSFNITLVDFLNSKNAEISDFENLETFGRSLSSLGLSLLLMSFICKKKKLILPIYTAVLLGCSFTIYSAQTFVFEKIIETLPPEQKLAAYSMGVYRNLSLNNETKIHILNDVNKTYDESINSMFAVLLGNEKIKAQIISITQDFFRTENNVDKTSLAHTYQEIQSKQPNLDDYWGIYIIESKKFNLYTGPGKAIYERKFTELLGMPPNLSKVSFRAEMNKKIYRDFDINAVVIVPAFPNINAPALTLGMIPTGLTEQQWVDHVNQHIENLLSKSELNVINVQSLPHYKNIVSSVVVTPFAVALSLFAMFGNLILLVLKYSKLLAVAVAAAVLAASALWNYNPYGLNFIVNKAVGLQSMVVLAMTPYRTVLHQLLIDDTHISNPNVVRISKPEIPDMSESKQNLDKSFRKLGEDGQDISTKILKEATENTKVQKDRINDPRYFGTSNKPNPYAR